MTSIRGKAKILALGSCMRLGFQFFTPVYKIPPKRVSYSDFVIVRLLYEVSRGAGFWNMHWDITDQPPNLDRIWHQWQTAATASAECDELSALYLFLVERAGVKGVGLFWPTPSHGCRLGVISGRNAGGSRGGAHFTDISCQNDSFGSRKFDPWKQRRFMNTRRVMSPIPL